MKKIYVIFFIFFTYVNLIFSQSLEIAENQTEAQLINDSVPYNKILLVFESSIELVFESSMEHIHEPVKDGNVYKLLLSERFCVITIINPKTLSKVILPFGQHSSNSFPALKFGEIKYYLVSEKDKLLFFDETNLKKTEGASDNQMSYLREALLIINTDPSDIELEFKSTLKITDIRKERNQYKVFIQPEQQTIKIECKETKAYNDLTIDKIDVKEVRYYFISLPHYLRQIETQTLEADISLGSYKVESKPSGATIEMIGNPPFNREKNKTPFVFEGYETGAKIITLKLNEYEKISDTIYIGSGRVNKSVYELVPEFAFLNFNINPAPPYSRILIDGIEIKNISNNKDFKINKGDRRIEIRADHYYAETFIYPTIAGNRHPINVNLKPINGMLMIEAGANANGADVFIDNSKLGIINKKIGNLPFTQALDIQEGQYALTIRKKGFGTYQKVINIEKDKTLFEKINMVNAKDVIIATNIEGADISINGKEVGKSDLKINLGIGKYNIVVSKDNYYSYQGSIEVKEDDDYDIEKPKIDPFNFQNEGEIKNLHSYNNKFFITLKPMNFSYSFSLERKNEGVKLFVNNMFVDNLPCQTALKTGEHNILVKDTTGTIIYKSNIKVPSKKRKVIIPYYHPFDVSIVKFDIHGLDVLTLSYYGLGITLFSGYFPGKIDDYTMTGFGKAEFKMGGGISRHFDISAFANYNYVTISESVDNSEDRITHDKGHFYAYGLDVAYRPKLQNNLDAFSIFLRAGYYTNTLNFNYKGYIKPTDKPYFTFGLSWTSGTGILRLWKKPLTYRLYEPFKSADAVKNNFIFYNISESAFFGLTYGRVKDFGWYVKLKSNGNYFDYDYTANDIEINEYDYQGDNYYIFSDESKSIRYAATAGAVFRFNKNVYWNLGAGYGVSSILWKAEEFSFTDNEKVSDIWSLHTNSSISNIELETGIMLKFGNFGLKAGGSTIGFKFYEINGGIGVFF